MRRRRMQAWRWAVLVLLGTVHGAAAQSPGGASSTPSSTEDARAHSNGHYLHSYLAAPKPEKPCPPQVDVNYRADVIVTGTDMRQRPWGFAQTFRTVLVKASGDPRLKDDPRAVALAEQADASVLCFDYVDMMAGIPIKDEQGTYDRPHRLTVSFDPARIDAILADFGDKPWHGERPVVVPVLLVQGPRPPPYLLSAEEPRGADQRAAFATAAGEYGLKVRFPADAELKAWGVSAEQFPAAAPKSPGGEALVAGTLAWNESLPGWVGQWRSEWHGVAYRWEISGVNYDAAFRDIARGVLQLASGKGPPG